MRQWSICFYLSNKKWAALHSQWQSSQPQAVWSAAGFTPSSQTLNCPRVSPPWHVLRLTPCAENNLHLLSGLNSVNISHKALQSMKALQHGWDNTSRRADNTRLSLITVLSALPPQTEGVLQFPKAISLYQMWNEVLWADRATDEAGGFLHWVEAGCPKSPALPPSTWPILPGVSWWHGKGDTVQRWSATLGFSRQIKLLNN